MNEMVPEQVSSGKREPKYELLVGQLMAIVIIGILVSIGSGFLVGKYVGFAQGSSTAVVEKPEYCSADKVDGHIVVRCNELGNVSLDSLCKWASPDLMEKIRLVIITS